MERIVKIAAGIEMSFETPTVEKKVGKEAKIRFEAALSRLNHAIEHLDVIYEPFDKYETVSKSSLVKKKGLIHRFKQKVIDNFNDFKTISLLAIRKINFFSTGDVAIQEIENSFINAIGDLEKLVDDLIDRLDDYESDSFRQDILNSIDSIKSQGDSLDTLINDRIIEHIDSEIVARTWMDDKKKELKLELEEKTPIIQELFQERQKALEGGKFPSSNKEQQSLNVSDAQKVHYPDYTRTMNIGEFGG
jgi:hypothetical protein